MVTLPNRVIGRVFRIRWCHAPSDLRRRVRPSEPPPVGYGAPAARARGDRVHVLPGAGGRASPSASEPPVSRVDLSGLPVARAAFCDLLDQESIGDALGGTVIGTDHYGNGDEVNITPDLEDISHEFNCTYYGAPPPRHGCGCSPARCSSRRPGPWSGRRAGQRLLVPGHGRVRLAVRRLGLPRGHRPAGGPGAAAGAVRRQLAQLRADPARLGQGGPHGAGGRGDGAVVHRRGDHDRRPPLTGRHAACPAQVRRRRPCRRRGASGCPPRGTRRSRRRRPPAGCRSRSRCAGP